MSKGNGFSAYYTRIKAITRRVAQAVGDRRDPRFDGRFSCFYGGQGMGPLVFSRWVKEQGYTFKEKTLLWSGLAYTDFRGTLKELSCPFSFRIYSKSLTEEVRKAIK